MTQVTDERLGKFSRFQHDIYERVRKGSLDANEVEKILRPLIGQKINEHFIDCDAAPFLPEGWKVEEHQKMGKIKFDSAKIDLYLSKKQKNGIIEGSKLSEELKGKKVLNANVLDYLLKNPHLIPEEWKGKYIFFWGTIFYFVGCICVRYLYWSGGRWYWDGFAFAHDFNSDCPAALLAS